MRGLTFIFNNLSIGDKILPFRISDDIVLREATEKEIELLYNKLKEFYGLSYGWIKPSNEILYRFKQLKWSKDSRKLNLLDFQFQSINFSDLKLFKYTPIKWYVIDFNGSNKKIIRLEKLAKLLNPKLNFGLDFLYFKDDDTNAMFTLPQAVKIDIVVHESRKETVLVKDEELKKLKNYYDNVDIEHLDYVLDLYSSSSTLFHESTLFTLSLFSIIESLIAHKPRLTETLDSITHQIKNKLFLLSKRFEQNIDKTEYFGEINHEKLWMKLYGLRSDIAHGQTFNFESGNYVSLKSLKNANEYLDMVTKELIKIAILEPDLVSDLREC